MKKSTLFLLLMALLLATAGCGGEQEQVADVPSEPEVVEEEEQAEIPAPVLGVIVGNAEGGSNPTITMLVDGSPKELPLVADLYPLVVTDWDHYSHWGLYQAEFNSEGLVFSLEYGLGVEDIIGIFADYYDEKEMPDVIAVDGNTVTIISIDYLLDSDDPDDLPGFSTEINESLTPAVGESFTLSPSVIVYVEGPDGLFYTGDVSYIDAPGYDYVEFYDVDGDLIYDIVIVWLV